MNVFSVAYGKIYGISNKMGQISRLLDIAYLGLYHARYVLQKIFIVKPFKI